MTSPSSDKAFTGSIPRVYEEYLVPLLFEPYAADLAARLAAMRVDRVLELAAGTGVVTRAIATVLPERVSIVATDLNQAMLDQAAAVPINRLVEWRQADALQLPFESGTFDAVVCQFGVMFFPDKAKAFQEARRVLKKGGWFIFNVWDRLAANEFCDTIERSLVSVFPDDPPGFLGRTPYGYNDRGVIERDLRNGGFTAPGHVVTMPARSRASSARNAAVAICQGTPLRTEIESRDAAGLEHATNVAATALTARFGAGEVDGKIQAHIVS